MIIGEKIKLFRKSKKMTQVELAKELFISYQLVSKWERNISEPTTQMLFTIINKYDLPLNFFMKYQLNDNDDRKKNIIFNSFIDSMYQSPYSFPSFKRIAQIANINQIDIYTFFQSEEELMYEFINKIDQSIKIDVESHMKTGKNIVDIFIEDMAPLLYDKRSELYLLYTRIYIKDIWIEFITIKYKKLFQKYYGEFNINDLNSSYFVNVLTSFISVWMNQKNTEPLYSFQSRMRNVTSTPIHDWSKTLLS